MQASENAPEKNAVQKNVLEDTSSRLGLLAFCGISVLQDPRRYTRYGQIKDDVERSLRYFHLDGALLRFQSYGVDKLHKPSQFGAREGGISANSSAEAHQIESTEALLGIIKEFASRYVKPVDLRGVLT